ncbi:hypothetical protein [Levilactobacillus humaensis]|uniref:hypothetical protein n=1 Tax=Levilactobacillus humaensis TaxID=2950375 RepID=UPI0021C36964|nr:hypothetical protein [Levilactobacillus humaensis]
MKLKKLLLQLGLLLTVTFLGLTGIRMAEAAATIPAGSSVVSMDGNVYIPNKTTWTTVPNIEDGYTSLGYYPSILDIRANNLSATGRVTTKTTKIWVLYGSYMTEKNGGTFGNVYADIMTDGGGTVTTNSPVNMMSSASKKFTPPNTYQEMTVDLSDLAHDLPLYVGLRYTMQNSYDDPRPYFGGQITADKLAATTLKDVLITPTSGTDTNGVSNLSSSDTSISGTAEPSSTVSVTLNGKVYSTTASSGSDGAYTIPLGASLKSLGATDSVKVTESNDEGDSKSSTANVTSTVPLTITSATPIPNHLTR